MGRRLLKRHEILKRSSEIRRTILGEIEKNPKGITASIVQKFKITRQAATRYLTQMVAEGQLKAEGATKNRTYKLGRTSQLTKTYDLTASLEESKIWTDDFKSLCEGIKPNVLGICAYGFTEMVNNALDHSGGKVLTVIFGRTPKAILMGVEDDGVGIFGKIKKAFHLSDERQAILELSKGKLTTDPAKHTGEGIFFTSRIFDQFSVNSHDLAFSHQESMDNYFLLHQKNELKGTRVLMKIKTNSKRKLKKVFDEFADPDNNYAFDKTIVPVRLAQYEGEELLSRSQAKRLMLRVENFKTVILDFEGVKSVGPAFADEIFRVYKNEHPNVELIPSHESEEVKKMINRARAADQAAQG
jgi:anti-sigma regulatory factor (Ser/Thr protein kinase)